MSFAVGMGVFVVHILDAMSYASFVARIPDGEEEEKALTSNSI